ncbi:MAG TPA: response regulator, partial [Candidatus Obscuribacterales bacterium]
YFCQTRHQLTFAEDGLQGVQTAQAQLPDLILLDLRMPLMSGQEAAAMLRQHPATRHIPIIFITASSRYEEASIPPDLYEGLLHKPVKRRHLAELIQRIVLCPTAQPAPAAPRCDIVASLPPPALTPTQLTALLQRLQAIAADLWPTVCQTLDTHSLESFMAQLRAAIAHAPYPPLDRYLRTLETQFDHFDWEELPYTVNRFPSLIAALSQDLESLPAPATDD